MGTTKTIEKNALTEMMSPSVSPSAARDAGVKKSVKTALQDFTPKNGIADYYCPLNHKKLSPTS